VDVLSEVLKVVKLQGAMFYNGETSSPCSLCSPPSSSVAPYLAPDAGLAKRDTLLAHRRSLESVYWLVGTGMDDQPLVKLSSPKTPYLGQCGHA